MDAFRSRINKLQAKMKLNNIDGYLVTQNVDLYYLTGSMQTGYLFVPAEGDPTFYVRRSMVRAEQESGCKVAALGSFRKFGDTLAKDYPYFTRKERPVLALEYDVLPVQLFVRLQSVLPHVQWTDGSTLLREVRMIKSEDELIIIRKAAAAVDTALEQAVAQIREGMTELQLITLIEQFLREQGHAGMMRMRGYNQEIITGMVASGKAAAEPTYFDGPAGGQGLSPANPQGASRKVIGRNEPILVDIGCSIDGYVIDQTRTLVIGELPEHLVQAYQLSERVLRQTEAMLKPGTVCEELYTRALQTVREAGLGEHFMGYGADQVKFLGHGIGLEIDELPVLAKGFAYPLEPGMVIAVEPKFTFPGEGVVGIENSYVITATGFEKLTLSREGILKI